MVEVRVLTGAALDGTLDDVARLRITVFRDWPYLYDGDLAYEARYLADFAASKGAVVVGAFDDGRLIGAATGAPMEDHAEDFARAFEGQDLALTDVFYCAESVLLPEYRGRGLGHAFFDHREAQARRLGRRFSAFCSVVRPDDHPARPGTYRPLDAFWKKRDYEKLEGVLAHFSWKDVGNMESTTKSLQFWMRDLERRS